MLRRRAVREGVSPHVLITIHFARARARTCLSCRTAAAHGTTNLQTTARVLLGEVRVSHERGSAWDPGSTWSLGVTDVVTLRFLTCGNVMIGNSCSFLCA